VIGLGGFWVLVALFMLVRNGLAAARLLRAPEGRLRAVVPLLTCLVALAVLVMAAREVLLAPPRPPGGPQ
jgi:apolipoprotein N-acyltransferase